MANQAFLCFASATLLLLVLSLCFSQSSSSSSSPSIPPLASNDEKGAAFIRDTCKNAEHYDICVSSLESDPRNFKADVVGLSRISIELAKANATGVLDYIDNLIHTSKNISKTIKLCKQSYDTVIENLQTAIEFLDRADYRETIVFILSAETNTDDCNTDYSAVLDELPSTLTQLNELMFIHYGICFHILCLFSTCG